MCMAAVRYALVLRSARPVLTSMLLSAQAWRSEVLKHIALQPCTFHSTFNILKP